MSVRAQELARLFISAMNEQNVSKQELRDFVRCTDADITRIVSATWGPTDAKSSSRCEMLCAMSYALGLNTAYVLTLAGSRADNKHQHKLITALNGALAPELVKRIQHISSFSEQNQQELIVFLDDFIAMMDAKRALQAKNEL